METREAVYSRKYSVGISQVNINKRLGLYGLLNFLQDIATNHAEFMDFGIKEMERLQAFWVLVRKELRMEKFPAWNEEITIQTWTREFDGMYAYRDFAIFLNDEKIGDCSTVWMLLDGVTRKVRKPELFKEKIIPRLEGTLTYIAPKVDMPESYEDRGKLIVKNSDLDPNMHVNNTKYTQWILDSIPIEIHKEANLKRFKINFLSECHLGDEIQILAQKRESDIYTHDVLYKGVRTQDGRTVFLANLMGL